MTPADYILAAIVLLCGLVALLVVVILVAAWFYERWALRADLREPLNDPPRHFEARATPIRRRDHA